MYSMLENTNVYCRRIFLILWKVIFSYDIALIMNPCSSLRCRLLYVNQISTWEDSFQSLQLMSATAHACKVTDNMLFFYLFVFQKYCLNSLFLFICHTPNMKRVFAQWKISEKCSKIWQTFEIRLQLHCFLESHPS